MTDKKFINKFIKTVQRVMSDWEFMMIALVVLFFPWSLIYVGFLIFQEWEVEEEGDDR